MLSGNTESVFTIMVILVTELCLLHGNRRPVTYFGLFYLLSIDDLVISPHEASFFLVAKQNEFVVKVRNCIVWLNVLMNILTEQLLLDKFNQFSFYFIAHKYFKTLNESFPQLLLKCSVHKENLKTMHISTVSWEGLHVVPLFLILK